MDCRFSGSYFGSMFKLSSWLCLRPATVFMHICDCGGVFLKFIPNGQCGWLVVCHFMMASSSFNRTVWELDTGTSTNRERIIASFCKAASNLLGWGQSYRWLCLWVSEARMATEHVLWRWAGRVQPASAKLGSLSPLLVLSHVALKSLQGCPLAPKAWLPFLWGYPWRARIGSSCTGHLLFLWTGLEAAFVWSWSNACSSMRRRRR